MQDRADRGQPRRAHHAGQWPQRLAGDLHLRGAVQPDRHQSRTHGDDRVDVRGVLQHPQGPRSGRGRALCRRSDSTTCSTSLRGSAMSTPPASARRAPSASAAERTAERSAYSASPRSRCSASASRRAPSTPSTTVRTDRLRFRTRRRLADVVVFEVGHQADCASTAIARDDERLARGHRVALKLGARRQAADVAGYRQRDADRGRRAARAGRGAQRLQQRHRARIGQVRPGQAGACRPRPSHMRSRNVLAPIVIAHPGHRRARRHLQARRWPTPTTTHSGTT